MYVSFAVAAMASVLLDEERLAHAHGEGMHVCANLRLCARAYVLWHVFVCLEPGASFAYLLSNTLIFDLPKFQ